MAMVHSMIMIVMLMLYLACVTTRCLHNKLRKIVIDTDPGADDALALLLALMYEAKTPDVKIMAITATYGNTDLENVEKNLLKILTIANRSDIPLYSGPKNPLINEHKFDDYFGNDGFGDFNFTKEIITDIDRSQYAPVVLADLVKRYPGEITVISLGPLTTVAVAVALEPNFLHLVKEHVIMGSNINGNNIEFNFNQDPESNWIALNNTNKPSMIIPINLISNTSISKEEYRNIYSKLNPCIATFLHLAERKALEKQDTWQPADGITMAIALRPGLIKQSIETNLRPILEGDARGLVAIDPSNPKHNVNIIEEIHLNAFKNMLIEYLS